VLTLEQKVLAVTVSEEPEEEQYQTWLVPFAVFVSYTTLWLLW